MHGDALEHVDQSELKVEDGDLVFVKNDREEVKKNQEGHGGWHPQMANVSSVNLAASSLIDFVK